MTKKIVLTVMIILALLIAVYKWIMSNDIENEENKQETTTEEVKEPANNESENVKPEETTEEVKENGNDTVENHNK